MVANGYPPTAFGGVEVYVQGIAHALASRGHHVTVFCRESAWKTPDYHVIREMSDRVSVIRLVNDFKAISSFEETFVDPHIDAFFGDLLHELTPDLVHFHHWIALSARLPSVASEQGIPSVATLHDYWAICHRVNLQDWLGRRCPGPDRGGDCLQCVIHSGRFRAMRRLLAKELRKVLRFTLRQRLRRALVPDRGSVISFRATREAFATRQRTFRDNLIVSRKILAPSDFVKRTFGENGYDNVDIEVLPLGIRLPTLSRPAASFSTQVRFAFIGTLLPTKGVHVLVKAFKGAPSSALQLRIYGRDDADPAYTHRLRRLARGDARISFEGPFAPEARENAFRDTDVVVVPSLVPETFSLVAREALAAGRPVIVSDVGALPEVVKDHVNGYLVPPGDVQSLSELIQEIALHPRALQDLTLPGPTPILSVDDHVTPLERIYGASV